MLLRYWLRTEGGIELDGVPPVTVDAVTAV